MKPTEQKRFDTLYAQHVRGLKLHGYSTSTIDVYSRAVRRLASYYDCVPDQLSVEQRKSISPPWSIAIPGVPSG